MSRFEAANERRTLLSGARTEEGYRRKSLTIDPNGPSGFLTDLVDKDVRVTLLVDDGRQEIGRLIGMDDEAIVIKQAEGATQLIFRHAIAVLEQVHMHAEPERWGYMHADEFRTQQPS